MNDLGVVSQIFILLGYSGAVCLVLQEGSRVTGDLSDRVLLTVIPYLVGGIAAPSSRSGFVRYSRFLEKFFLNWYGPEQLPLQIFGKRLKREKFLVDWHLGSVP